VSDWLKESIKSSIFTIQFGSRMDCGRVRTGSDDSEALTYLPEAQALEDNAHKVLTQKLRHGAGRSRLVGLRCCEKAIRSDGLFAA